MALIDDVEAVCSRLATDAGWHALLLRHGLDIKARPLAAALSKTLSVDRTLKGFEDFSLIGQRGIEAASPARSLLFHALASPNVTTDPSGNPLQLFPTAAEIERVLNYVYGVRLPSLADLQQQAGVGTQLAIVVFAAQYQPGPDTGHRKHADLCFSRTGIARVGTAPAHYDPQRRGFLPWTDNDPKAICVTPARYCPYIAMQQTGDVPGFGPWPVQPGDENLKFWVPLHKLFDGPECIAGMDVHVHMELYHINEKLRQFHSRFAGTGWGEPDISNSPFVTTEDLVEWADEQTYGKGLLIPAAKPRLVEEAVYQGKPLFFSIPPNPVYGGYIINRRFKQRNDGSVEDLNLNPDVEQIVKDGGYSALHIIDSTAEGWVRAICPQLADAVTNNVVAYSLAAAPDFYPELTQRSLLDWSNQQAFPQPFFGATLRVLSDRRAAGNPNLEGGHFQVDDKSITAVVSHLLDDTAHRKMDDVDSARRHTWLCFAGAGFFSPGWEISGNGFNPSHLNAFELGCPFTEDIRICASIGGYWAAVSPDNSSAFEPTNDWISIIPLTRDELGSWDGTHRPQLINLGNGNQVVEYQNYAFTDYTKNALAGLLSVHPLAQTTVEDYRARILSMHNAFKALGATTRQEKKAWSVLSFRKTVRPDTDLNQAESATGTVLQPPVHRYQIYKNDTPNTTTPTHDFTKRHAVVVELVELFVGPTSLLIKRENSPWQAQPIA